MAGAIGFRLTIARESDAPKHLPACAPALLVVVGVPMERGSSFAQALKQRRKALDLTQLQLAEQVGCAAVTIQRIEQGTLRPSRQVAERLAAILAIPAEEREPFVRLARGAPTSDPFKSQEWPEASSARPLLPAPLTPLIGRLQEVQAVCAALSDSAVRLLTLTGPGGIGKTRLALQVAAHLEPAFAHGAVFVDLAPLSDPSLMASSIAQTLGLQDLGSQPLTLTLQRYLRDKHLLLVLDNFEQVLEAAPLLAKLLAAAPGLKLLLTSRVVVGVYGEHAFLVPPLILPDLNDLPPYDRLLEVEAVRLFVEHARAARADFRLGEANSRLVSEICHRLDGLPLAIELAAARVRLLPLQALLIRLSSRLELLRGGPRTLPARQQTLRATIDWSYQLLDSKEQRLFRRLAVFVGGCTLKAVEAVCVDVGLPIMDGGLGTQAAAAHHLQSTIQTILEELAALIDKSLLQQREDADGEPRVAMLETIREYALEQLAASTELDTLRQRHAAYFLALAETADSEMRLGSSQVTWLNRLEREQPNLRAALAWILQTEDLVIPRDSENNRQQAELGLRLAVALRRFWGGRGYLSEGRGWLADALTRAEASRASGVPTAAYRSLRATALRWVATFATWQGDHAAAHPAYEECLALFRELQDTKGIAHALSHLGMLFQMRGDYGRAESLLQESLAMDRESGDSLGVAWNLFFLGTLEYSQGNIRRASQLWEESLIGLRASGDLGGITGALTDLSMVALDEGDYGRAGVHLAESLTLLRELGSRWQLAHTLEVVAGLAALAAGQVNAQPRGLQAARLFGAAEALRETLGTPLLPIYQDHYQRRLASARTLIDEATFAAAWAEGRAIALEQAIAEALEVLQDAPLTKARPRL